MKRTSSDRDADSRTPFERFEDMARRVVNMPRKDVPPMKRTPRPKPTTQRKPRRRD